MVASDKSGLMVEVLRKELDKFVSIKEKFVDEFSLEDFEYIDEVRIGRKRFCNEAHLPPRAGGANWSAVALETRRGGSSRQPSSLFLPRVTFAPNKGCQQSIVSMACSAAQSFVWEDQHSWWLPSPWLPSPMPSPAPPCPCQSLPAGRLKTTWFSQLAAREQR